MSINYSRVSPNLEISFALYISINYSMTYLPL